MAQLPLNFFTSKFAKFDLKETGNGYKLSLNFKAMGRKLDLAQDILDKQVWQDVQKYMPYDTHTLINQTNALNAVVRGRVYLYPPTLAYGHYQHEGIVYVDPVYHVGGFYIDGVGWRSRKDVTKIPSNKQLKYTNPMATPRWGETAFKNHSKEWLELVKRALK